ncbi:MAG: ComF family protein [Saprospiraceae bacterium]|nr:ComF family protein [Saprospiraceae bacterium]
MLKKLIKGFSDLFYPRYCFACNKDVPPQGMIICIKCEAELPLTNFHHYKENPFTERFAGKVNIATGTALYHFTKGSKTQNLIHQLKYKGKKSIGIECGEYLGSLLKDSPLYKDIDVLIPVPMHPKKEHERGYNQANLIAEGISNSSGIPWTSKMLLKSKATTSQTKKGRLERSENVEDVFCIAKKANFKAKNVLLVDDILTTGATLEHCASLILDDGAKSVSLATLGITKF